MIELYKGYNKNTKQILTGSLYEIPNIYGELNKYIVSDPTMISTIKQVTKSSNRVHRIFRCTYVESVTGDLVFEGQYISGELKSENFMSVEYGIVRFIDGAYCIRCSNGIIPISDLINIRVIDDVCHYDTLKQSVRPETKFIENVITDLYGDDNQFIDNINIDVVYGATELDTIYKKIVDMKTELDTIKKKHDGLKIFVKKLIKDMLGNRYRKFKMRDVDTYNGKTFKKILDEIKRISFD